jgi:glycerate dehydrogenase
MNIVFLDKSTVGDLTNLSRLATFGKVKFFETTSYNETTERTKDADVVITNKVLIDKNIMDASPKLKLICIAATGMNNVDLDYAAVKGIEVKNVSGYSTFSVTQSTFTLVLSLVNSIPYYDEYVKSGQYSKSPIFTHLNHEFRELSGKTFGIIGMGAIGQSVAKVANALGCRVIYFSTSGKNLEQPYECVTLERLLTRSDIVSIHAPLNETTFNLIDLPKIQLMKKNALLINVGRGNIVNEEDLAYALEHKLIGGAGLDVFSHEPIKPDNPLLRIKHDERLILTPHIAWASIEARELLIDKVYDNIHTFILKDQV